MTPPLPHRIMRERVEVEFFDCADPLAARQRIEDLCASQLSQALDNALSAWDIPHDELLSIDHVHVNVTDLNEQNLESELVPKIIRALNLALEQQLRVAQRAPTSRARPVSRSVLEEVCFFLEHGFLPWPVSKPEEWQLQVAEVLSRTPYRELSPLLSALRSASGRQRFVRHFPAVVRKVILPSLWSPPDLEQLWEGVELLVKSSPAPALPDLHFDEDLLIILLEHGILPDEDRPAALLAAAKAIRKRVVQGKPPSPPLTIVPSVISSFSVPSANEPIFINNAGLVIVAPYLPAFFTNMGLARENELLRAPEALRLTHYLVFGSSECWEWDLVLGKILCGIPLEEAVRMSGELLPAQITEANALLVEVIKNWPALKNTSPDGLCETFLRRNGILTSDPAGWKLLVEPKPPDVLLDTLPWTISMIRLPWMPCMLITEWGSE